MEQPNDRSLRLQQALLKALKEVYGDEWGYHIPSNWGLEADLVAEFDKMPDESLRLLKRHVTPEGLQLYVEVSRTLTSLQEITSAVHHLLYAVGKRLFVFLPLLDEEYLKYWFVIGSDLSGHIGEIMVSRESIRHIDVLVLENEMDWAQYITKL